MIRHIFYILLISFTILAGILAHRLGAFKTAKIEIHNETQFHILFKEHIGPYHKIVPVIKDVETWAKEHKISCTKTFGEFLDDPEDSDSERMRSYGGCVLTANTKIITKLPKGFSSKKIQLNNHIFAEFTGSPGIGPWKVYSPVFELIEKRRFKRQLPTYEVYEITGPDSMTTRYYFPFN